MAEAEMASTRFPFTDPISDRKVVLVITGEDARWWDGRSGVEHPSPEGPTCEQLADVSVDLDAFYCPACGRNGRLSGAWAMDALRLHRERVGV